MDDNIGDVVVVIDDVAISGGAEYFKPSPAEAGILQVQLRIL